MAQRRLSIMDISFAALSLLTLLLDITTDILVAVQFLVTGHVIWGIVLAVLIVLPLLVMNVLSAKWHFNDKSLTLRTALPHIFLVAPVQRYLKVIRFGILSRLTGHPKHTDAALREQNDVCILRLVETFMESAPQLVLQLYIFLYNPTEHSHTLWLYALSATSSLVSLGWAMTAYTDTLRLAYRTAYHRRFLALLVHFFWQLCMVCSRVMALVLFALVFHAWVFLFAGAHWVVMVIYLFVSGTDFGSGRVERAGFRLVSAFIYIFVFLNLHDGPSRGRMAAFYCVMLLENSLLYALWVIYSDGHHPYLDIPVPLIVFGAFIVGGVCLTVYYRWLHPSGPNYVFSIKSAANLRQQLRRTAAQQRTAASANTSSVLGNVTLELSAEATSPGSQSANRSHLDASACEALQSAWQSGMDSSDSSSTSSLDEQDCSLDEFNSTAGSAVPDVVRKAQSKGMTTTTSQASVDKAQSRGSPQRPRARSLLGASYSSHSSITSMVNSMRLSTSARSQREPNDGGLSASESQEDPGGSRLSVSCRAREQENGRLSVSNGPQDLESSMALSGASGNPSSGIVRGILRPPSRHGWSHAGENRTHSSHRGDADGREDVVQVSPNGTRDHGASFHSASSGGQNDRNDHSRSRHGSQASLSLPATSHIHHNHSGSSEHGGRQRNSQASLSQSATSQNLDGTNSSERVRQQLNSDRVRRQRSSQEILSHSATSYSDSSDANRSRHSRHRPSSASVLQRSFDLDQRDHSGLGEFLASDARNTPNPLSECRSTRRSLSSQRLSLSALSSHIEQDELGHINADHFTIRNFSFYSQQQDQPLDLSMHSHFDQTRTDLSMTSPFVGLPHTALDSRSQPAEFHTSSGFPPADLSASSQPPEFRQSNNESSSPRADAAIASPCCNSNSSPGESGIAEDSWTSMNVNADDESCLGHLQELTPDQSMCSFSSSKQSEILGSSPRSDSHASAMSHLHSQPDKYSEYFKESSALAEALLADLQPELVSGHRSDSDPSILSPGLSRSHSTSSLRAEFCTEGFTPSPPARRLSLSHNHSWADTPESWKHSWLDTPWRLDYLDINPAPPVEREAYSMEYDAREVIIDLLLDHLQRCSLRSSGQQGALSPLHLRHLQRSPRRLGQGVKPFSTRVTSTLASGGHSGAEGLNVSNPTRLPQSEQRHDCDGHISQPLTQRIDSNAGFSPFHLSDMQQSPTRFGRSVDLFDRQAWRRLLLNSSQAEDSVDSTRLLAQAMDLLQFQQSPGAHRRSNHQTHDSPDQYVSGQYRPPICRESISRKQVSSGEVRPGQECSCSRQPLFESDRGKQQRDPAQCPVCAKPPAGRSQIPANSGDTAMMASSVLERSAGLYKYFVATDSPGTPHWNTPVATPMRPHLLHRYLKENQVDTPTQVLKAVSVTPGSAKVASVASLSGENRSDVNGRPSVVSNTASTGNQGFPVEAGLETTVNSSRRSEKPKSPVKDKTTSERSRGATETKSRSPVKVGFTESTKSTRKLEARSPVKEERAGKDRSRKRSEVMPKFAEEGSEAPARALPNRPSFDNLQSSHIRHSRSTDVTRGKARERLESAQSKKSFIQKEASNSHSSDCKQQDLRISTSRQPLQSLDNSPSLSPDSTIERAVSNNSTPPKRRVEGRRQQRASKRIADNQ